MTLHVSRSRMRLDAALRYGYITHPLTEATLLGKAQVAA